MNYSFKHNFHWPPTAAPPSGPALGAAAAGAPTGASPIHGPHPHVFTHHGYHGGHFHRRMFRFGFFRRFFWFSLGAGAATFYFKQKQRRVESERVSGGTGTVCGTELGRKGWKSWRDTQDEWQYPRAHPSPTALPADVAVAAQPSAEPDVRHSLWSNKGPSSPPSYPPAAASTQGTTFDKDDIKSLRAALHRLVLEKKVEAETAVEKAKVNVDAREYAREKLDRLSVILEGLRENLAKDEGKGSKLV
ncbi:uncharacterized protein MKK02DRAFT_39172 [Dioszegia hungarica]|uniref:Uncharacterized protein n=1 Tax=Dioszegia hungarica TaxID=4972 RepID=A0AA38LS84_9TREE|nr:uncharacterized protein MKK02DRAFT_39172 [Dioszegia hungarica]KAI9633193.1 hypothetical protein MKK02DRAFT_39172 [Dioszegia hungarica]